MKKILLLITLLFLVGCSAAPAAEAVPAADAADQTSQQADTEGNVAVLEYQVSDLTDKLATLQAEYDTLLAASEGQSAEAQSSGFMCENQLGNMKYQNPIGTIAILEGWFAQQDFVQEMQGTYSTTFWNDVNSRIHTIRYISAEDGLTTTANFLIMFEEAGWQPGILWMTESCWLDYPY